MKNKDDLILLKNKIRSLPEAPGVYQFFDQSGTLLYVGKAKNLRKRVSSYFNKESGLSGKTQMLVRKTTGIETIVVETEYDALLLENSMIKKYQPRYNIMLKDDKTYPWICIKNEEFPRVFPARTLIQDGSQYFGPYASVRSMNNLLELIRQIYSIRSCKYKLSPANISAEKYKVCLEFHIGNCNGPCEGKQSADAYNNMISEIKDIIKGNIHAVMRNLKNLMQNHAEQYEFEKAQEIKEKLNLLERYQSRSTLVNPAIGHVDVFSFMDDQSSAYINFMKVTQGCVVQSQTVEVKKKLDESSEDILLLVIAELRSRKISEAEDILLPFMVDWEIPGAHIQVPQKGDKKKLLELSLRNAFHYNAELEKKKELADPERHSRRIMEKMKQDLRLKETPEHIECFDNSNIQGEEAVSAMVVFRKTKPSKNEYRHYNIRSVRGPDDYASMEEVITRRYTRLLKEERELPHLIVVDGGKGQLSSAVSVLKKLGIYGKIGIVGIAKKLEEIYYPNDPLPLYLDKKSETLRVLQHLRDEAHRFGITHHRKRREKKTIKSELTEIAGIGDKAAQKLLAHFKSVKKIREANQSEIAAIVGAHKADVIVKYFKQITHGTLKSKTITNH